jgi:hypothetical protein
MLAFKGRAGHPWEAFPTRSTGFSSQIQWSPLVDILDSQLKEVITKAALEAFHKMDPPKNAPASGKWW